MKKTLFLAAALGALFTFSCQKPEANTPGGGDDKTPSGKTLAAPALQADKTAVTLDEASAAQEALKLTWTSGLSEGDNEPVSYTLYANAEGKDLFTDPQKFEAGKALQKAFTGEQLNSLAAKLGISEEGKIVFGVYAVADKGTYESQLSNKVSVTVTLYKATSKVQTHCIWLARQPLTDGIFRRPWNFPTTVITFTRHRKFLSASFPRALMPASSFISPAAEMVRIPGLSARILHLRTLETQS